MKLNTVESDLVQKAIDDRNRDDAIRDWERRFDLLSRDLMKACNGYLAKPEALDIVEKCAGDLVDIYTGLER
jgi:hypothetical protein